MTKELLTSNEQVSAEEVRQLIDGLRYRPVAMTAFQMRRAAQALEVTEAAFQGVMKDNADLAAEIERLTRELTDIRKGVLYHASPLAERDRLQAALHRIGFATHGVERHWQDFAVRAIEGKPVETDAEHGS